MNLKLSSFVFICVIIVFPEKTFSSQPSEPSFCVPGSTEDSSEFSLLEAFTRFPLSLTGKISAEETPQSVCMQRDSNFLEHLLDKGFAGMQALWNLMTESIQSSTDVTGLNIYIQELHIYYLWLLEIVTSFLTNLSTTLLVIGSEAMDATSQIWYTVTTWITSLPQAITEFTPTTGNITDQITEMAAFVRRLATEAWSTLLRYTVAAVFGFSCIKHLFRKEHHYRRDRHVKREQPKNQVTGSSVNARATQEPFKRPHSSERPLSHYPMCEVFDLLPCNCGGMATVNGTNRVDDVSQHFKMCVYFDKLPCNCGGAMAASNGENAIDFDKETIVSNEFICGPSSTLPIATCSGVKGKPLYERRRKTGCSEKQASPLKLYISGKSPKRETATNAAQELETQDEQEQLDVFDPTVDGSGNLVVYSMNASISSDIGDPVFNSSFKEDDLSEIHVSFHDEVSYISNTSLTSTGRDPLAAGDGVDSAILTRRSPFKEVGVSFDESDESDRPESFYDATSFPDITGLNNSVSFQDGDGLLELTMAFLVRKVFSWTMWFLRRRGMSFPAWKVHDVTGTKGGNLSNKLYLLLPRNRTRRRSVRSLPLSRNNSASVLTELTENGLSMNEITNEESLLERDTSRDVDFGKVNDPGHGKENDLISIDQVHIEFKENTRESDTRTIDVEPDCALTKTNKDIRDNDDQRQNSEAKSAESIDLLANLPNVESEAEVEVLTDDLENLSVEIDISVDIDDVSVEVEGEEENPENVLHGEEENPYEPDLLVD